MSLIAPAALGLLALAVPLIVMYMLRSRRRGIEVTSTLLWEDEKEFVSAALPWQRLRITAALVLQLLALALFAILLARPFFRETTLLGPHTVLIVDTSGSMALAGRLDAAKAQMQSLVAEASEEQLVSIVEAGARPRVLAAFSRDPAQLAALVDGLQPGGGTEDLEGALRLARGLATPDRPTSLLFLSDGGPAQVLDEPVTDARHVLFDASGDNLAVTGLGTNPVGEGPARIFVEVASFSPRTEDVAVAMTVDGLDVGTLRLAVPPGERRREVLAVDAGPGQVVEAAIVGDADANPLDDAAAVVLTGTASLGVTVVGEGSPFLDALVAATPGVTVPQGRPPDVVVVDGGSPDLVDRPAWLIHPEVPPAGVRLEGVVDNPRITFARSGEPLLEGLDFTEVAIARADIVAAPGWLPILSAGDVPLILLGEIDGHRVAYFTFDVVASNLPVQVAFPILGARILDWLGGSRLGTAATADAGAPLALTPPDGATSRVTRPDGVVQEVAADVIEYVRTELPGVYRVDYVKGDGEVIPGATATRRFAAGEAAGAARRIAVVEPGGAAGEEATLVREWAPALIALLLALVLLEWWVAFGRPRPRRRVVAT